MIPTTFEMDGLFTEEDIKNRNTLMIQCRSCRAWSKHEDYSYYKRLEPCSCGSTDYDRSSGKSLRTYDRFKDAKRKPS